MKIKINFTIDVPRESLAALRELAVADDNNAAAWFVREDAADYITDYLLANGVRGVTYTQQV